MSSTNHGTISAELDLRLVGPDRIVVPLPAALHYSSHDPYAITMLFDADRDEPVEWTFARDLLAAALHAPEGLGDVQAWPSAARSDSAKAEDGTGDKILNIVLGPPTGYARFEARAAGVEAFLARTYELVPAGSEPDSLDLDAELARLLSQA